MTDCTPFSNPCRRSYYEWGKAVGAGGDHFDRSSWDLINTLIAVRGINPDYFTEKQYESITVDESGKPENFIGEGSGNITKISFTEEKPIDKIKDELETLLCQKPKVFENEDSQIEKDIAFMSLLQSQLFLQWLNKSNNL